MMADAEDFGFTLLPADDEGIPPAQDADAATASALEDPLAVAEDPEPPVPFGRTYPFDYERRRMVRRGGAPVEVTGLTALREWLLAAAYTARGAHPIYSGEFGVTRPDWPIGEVDVDERVADYEDALREAWLVHDRVAAVENFSADFDPTTEVLTFSVDVVTDEDERVTFRDVVVPTVE